MERKIADDEISRIVFPYFTLEKDIRTQIQLRKAMKMYKKTILTIFAFASLLTTSFLTMAVPSVTIYVEPLTISISIDETFSINITITGVTDLYGWDVRLYYLNAILNGTEIIEGPFLRAAGETNFLIVDFDDAYNATHGRIVVACMLTGPVSGASGNGTLVTITFNSIGGGTTPIDIYFSDLVDSQGEHMIHSATDGSVQVSALIGDINGDGKVDIQDLVLVIRHYGSYPEHPDWNPDADVNGDGLVDIQDLVLVIKHYGEHI